MYRPAVSDRSGEILGAALSDVGNTIGEAMANKRANQQKASFLDGQLAALQQQGVIDDEWLEEYTGANLSKKEGLFVQKLAELDEQRRAEREAEDFRQRQALANLGHSQAMQRDQQRHAYDMIMDSIAAGREDEQRLQAIADQRAALDYQNDIRQQDALFKTQLNLAADELRRERAGEPDSPAAPTLFPQDMPDGSTIYLNANGTEVHREPPNMWKALYDLVEASKQNTSPAAPLADKEAAAKANMDRALSRVRVR